MLRVQSEIMDMKEELISDTIDDAIGADEEDEERWVWSVSHAHDHSFPLITLC